MIDRLGRIASDEPVPQLGLCWHGSNSIAALKVGIIEIPDLPW